ncbi:MAG: hypothetical protein WAV64_05575, partial [Candidatus Moraniibacteriota bacterium]
MKVAGTKKWSYRVNGNDLRFYDETNGSDKVTFQSGGNVGIGTTGPGYKLDVINTARVFNDVGAYSIANFYVGASKDGVGGAVPDIINLGGIRSQYTGSAWSTAKTSLLGPSIVAGSQPLEYILFKSDGTSQITSITGNVGIGTTSPLAPLDVFAPVNGDGIRVTRSTYAGQYIGINQGDYNSPTIKSIGSKEFYITSDSGIEFDVSSTGARVGTRALTILNTGNVGIGTTSPTSLLSLGYNAGSSDITVATVDGTDNGRLTLSGGGSYSANRGAVIELAGNEEPGSLGDMILRAGNIATGDVRIYTANSERLRINYDGNVGIGTTNPGAKLDVYSSTAAISSRLKSTYSNAISEISRADASSLGYTQYTTGNTSNWITGQMAGNSDFHIYDDIADIDRMTILSTGNVGIGTTGPTSTLTIKAATTDAGGGINVNSSTNANRIVSIQDSFSGDRGFIAVKTGGLDKIVLDAGGSSYFNSGNVGIGTTGPITPIDTRVAYAKNDTTARSVLFLGSNEAVTSYPFGLIGQIKGAATLANRTFILETTDYNSAGGGNLAFQVDGGNVGIGSTGAVRKLYVVGDAAFRGTGANNITLEISDNTTYTAFGRTSPTAPGLNLYSDGVLSFGAGGASEKVYINSTGNVGIGTTGPVSTLDVNIGSLSSGGITVSKTALIANQTIGFQLSDLNHGMFMSTGSGGVNKNELDFKEYGGVFKFINSSTSTELMRINSGNVGIGTTNPGYKLEVVSGLDWNIEGVSGRIGSASRHIDFGQYNTSQSYPSIQATKDASTAWSLLLNPNGGNVGIGTTGPGGKLEVYTTSEASPSLTGSTQFQIHASGTNRISMGLLSGSPFGGYIQMSSDGAGGAYPLLLNPTLGNVGIGTTSPGTLLHTYGGDITFEEFSTVSRTLKFDPNSGTIAAYYSTETYPRYKLGRDLGGSGKGAIGFGDGSSDVDAILYRDSADKLRTSDTLIIDGNVGIGTTNPTALFELGNNTGTSTGYIRLRGATALEGNIYHDATYGVRIDTSNNGYPIRIDGSQLHIMAGNAGIGTTGPGTKLDVNGEGTFRGTANFSPVLTLGTPAAINAVIDTADEIFFNIDSDNNQTGAGYHFRHNSTLGNAGAELVTFLDSGNVGIGTTGPTQLLHLYKDANAYIGMDIINPNTGAGAVSRVLLGQSTASSNYGGFYYFNPTFTTNGLFMADSFNVDSAGPGGLVLLSHNASAPMIFGTGGYAAANERMRITSTGNVGIGTTEPLEKLQVAGAMRITGALATASDGNWGAIDYASANTRFLSFSNTTNVRGTFSWYQAGLGNTAAQEAMRIDNQGNVGIGTTSPGAKLHIAGSDGAWSSTFKGNLNVAGAADNSLSVGSYSASPYGVWIQAGDNRISATTYPLLLNPISGNVGIGTTSPGAKLHIDGTADAGSALQIGGSANEPSLYNLKLQVDSVPSEGIKYSFIQKTNTNTYYPLTFQYNGNVGIGTTSPNYGLDIVSNSGVAIIGAGESSLFLKAPSAGGGLTYTLGTSWTNGFVPAGFYIDDGTAKRLVIKSGNVGIGTTSPGAKLQVDGDIYALNGDYKIGGSNRLINYMTDSTLTLKVWDSGASIGREIQKWDKAGSYFTSGNVGIGTTNPPAILSVHNPYATDGDVNPIVVSAYNGASVGGLYSVRNGTGGASGLVFDTFKQNVGLIEAMRIDNQGNVGIGTTAPDAKLYVAGNLMVGKTNKIGFNYDPGNTSLYNYIAWDTGGTEALTIAGGLWSGSATQQAINFKTQAVAVAVSILNNGNVGIGTTSPGAALHVIGQGYTTTGFRASASGNLVMGGYLATAGNEIAVYGGNLILQSGATNYTGNVGIGTTNPGANLTVMDSGSGTLLLQRNSTVAPSGTIRFSGLNGTEVFGSSIYGYNGTLQFNTQAQSTTNSLTERMRISNTGGVSVGNGTWNATDPGAGNLAIQGNVGIGTTEPREKLEVAGTLRLSSSTAFSANPGDGLAYVGTS